MRRWFGQQINDEQDRNGPENSQAVGETAIDRTAARVDVPDGNEDQYRKDDDRKGVDPGWGLQDIEVKHDDVPIRGKTPKEVIRGLRLFLAKAVGTGDQRQGGEPRSILRRQQVGAEQEQTRNDYIVGIIDNVFQSVAVEPGNEFFDPDRPRKGAVRGIDDNRQGHQPKRFLEKFLFNVEDGEESDDGAESGVKMYEPGEKEADRHPVVSGSRGGEARSSFQARDPSGRVSVFRVHWNLKSIQQIDVGHEGDIGETKGPRQVFAALQLFFDAVEALGNLGRGIGDHVGVPLSFGLTHFTKNLNEGRIKVAVAKIFQQPSSRPAF